MDIMNGLLGFGDKLYQAFLVEDRWRLYLDGLGVTLGITLGAICISTVLGMVLCLRSTGLSVAEIRRFVELAEKGPSTVRERYEIILAQKRRAEAERAAIDHKLEILERKLAHYEKQLPQSE